MSDTADLTALAERITDQLPQAVKGSQAHSQRAYCADRTRSCRTRHALFAGRHWNVLFETLIDICGG